MSFKTTTCFTPFQYVYGMEETFQIQCQIPSLKLVVELLPDTTAKEERLLSQHHLDETSQYVALTLESHKCRVEA